MKSEHHEDQEEQTIPYKDLETHKKLSLTYEIFKSSVPNIAACTTGQIANLINIYYLSKYADDRIVGAYGLGVVFTGAFVISMIMNFNQAGNILMAQAFGAKNYKLCGVSFQRNVVLLAIILVPLFIPLFFTDSILTAFSIDETVANLAAGYTRIMIPTAIASACFDSMKVFIVSQKDFTPVSVIQGITISLHILWATVFIQGLGLGVRGAALCRLIEECSNMVLIYIYIRRSNKFRETWLPWTKEALDKDGLKSQLKFSIPMIAMTYISWVYFEVMTIIAGTFGTRQTVTHVAIASTSSINFLITLGISITTMTYVANSIGKGYLNEAKNYFYAGMSLLSFLAVFFMVILLTTRDMWVKFWTLDMETQTYLLETVMIFSIIGLTSDSINNGLLGLLKAVGKQRLASTIVFITLYPVGITLMLFFAFFLNYQVKGLWIAFGISNTVLLIFAAVKISQIDWHNILLESKRRLKKDNEKFVELNPITDPNLDMPRRILLSD